MRDLIKRNITGRIVLVLFIMTNIIYSIMLIVSIPKVMSFSGGMKILDMMPAGYTMEYVTTLLDALGEKGRAAYLYNQIPLDMIYPLLFGVSYCLVFAYILNKLGKLDGAWFYLALLPLLAGAFDYCENIGIISILNSYPTISESMVRTTSIFSVLKSLISTIFFIILIIYLIFLAVKKFRPGKLMLLVLLFWSAESCAHSEPQALKYGDCNSAGKYYSIRGIKIYCEIYGSGKPLLMIHGNGGSISAFKNSIPYFANKYRVIVADSRAQGKSADPCDSLSFEMMADDEAALLDSLHIDSAYVLGWSDGGINALLLAMRHPEKVIKLASTGANLWPDSTAIIPSLWRHDKSRFDSTNPQNLKSPEEKNDWKLFLLDWYQPNIDLPSLHAIQCPSLIIGGDHDLIRVEHTTQIYQNIPNACLWILPNSGHGTLIDYSDEFNRKVDEFFTMPFHKF